MHFYSSFHSMEKWLPVVNLMHSHLKVVPSNSIVWYQSNSQFKICVIEDSTLLQKLKGFIWFDSIFAVCCDISLCYLNVKRAVYSHPYNKFETTFFTATRLQDNIQQNKKLQLTNQQILPRASHSNIQLPLTMIKTFFRMLGWCLQK